jgi:hypothetical protein
MSASTPHMDENLDVYCPGCGDGPQEAHVRLSRGARDGWPYSNNRTWFYVGDMDCRSCGRHYAIEMPTAPIQLPDPVCGRAQRREPPA